MAQSEMWPLLKSARDEAFGNFVRAEMYTIVLNVDAWAGPVCEAFGKMSTKELEGAAERIAARLAQPTEIMDDVIERILHDVAGATVEQLERKRIA